MASEVKTLTKDVWTKVLTAVTYYGQVAILDQEVEPTSYLIAVVDTGDPAPAVSFAGGIPFKYLFSPSNSVSSDYYIMPVNADGKVTILT